MGGWRLNDETPESALAQRLRQCLAALLLAAGVISLFFSSMAWPLVLAYVSVGAFVRILMNFGQVTGIAGLIILYAVADAPNWLRSEALNHQAWWQPGLLALTGLGMAHLTPQIIRRLH